MKAKTVTSIFNNWQQDIMHSKQLVHVSQFTLRPQAEKFWLQLELHIADNHGNDPYKDFFGTLSECVNQGLVWIEEEKTRLQELL